MANIIDNNLYDRQVRTYGEEAVKKISSSSVLIYGLGGGLGTEIIKNLALGGIKNIYLFDNDKITLADCETGFCYNQDNLSMVRSNILTKLQELNPYVTITSVDNYEMKQDVTILCNISTDIVKKVNQYTRLTKSKLVTLYSKGVSGVVFVDAGESHIVNDVTGENIEPVQIASITNTGLVTCAQYNSHNYMSGDTIDFCNMEGYNIEQFNKPWKIKVINKTSFQLIDFSNNIPFNFLNGTAIYIKTPKEFNHKIFETEIEKHTIGFNFDMIHANNLIDMYLQMYNNMLVDMMPPIWSNENNIFMKQHKVILPEFARMFHYELMPVISLMGSIASSEAIKLVTHKYSPMNQWFTWSDPNLLANMKNDANMKTMYGILYGEELERQLLDSKWLLVGSGAIGCEILKILAFMNIGDIIVTDPDTIEKSNLNRQFLFRNQDIGKHKSITAINSILKMKPSINIKADIMKVGNDNISYTDNIMNNISGVINALDNIQARRFMDEQCFKYNLPLFESGTTGTKGNTQPVIPFVTETYSALVDPEQDKSFPLCTIKSFPNEIQHTIHWAMDMFEFFNRGPMNVNNWLEKKDYLTTLQENEKNIATDDINLFVNKYPIQLDTINTIKWIIDMFNENYYTNIIKLLDTFKPDHEISPGVMFWSAGKKCPHPIKFDMNNTLHIDYIEATANLLANCNGLKNNYTREQLIVLLSEYEMKENEMKEYEINDSMKLLFKNTFVPQIFEKDNDTNWHVKWITAASNLRATNYNIPTSSEQQTKGIAGRIIPAIATTTSAVSGLIVLEILKYLLGFDVVDKYRATFINLAEPVLIYTEPFKAPMLKIANTMVNNWFKFDYKDNTSLKKFKEHYEQMFQTKISMIVIDTVMIYAEFMDESLLDEQLSKIILTSLELDILPKVTVFTLVSDDMQELPSIQIKL